MKLIYTKYSKQIIILLLLSLIQILQAYNIEELIKPICSNNSIKYSIVAKLKEYLEFQNNIDKKEMYTSLDVFKSKKLGTLSGTYYNKTIYKSVKEYDTYEQLFGELRTFKIDGVIQPDKYAEDIKFFSDDLSLFPEPIQINKIGFGIQKNNVTLKNQINEFIKNYKNFHEEKINAWSRFNFDEKNIDTELTGENGILNVVVRFANYPYTYKEDNKIMGSEIEFIYLFAKVYRYNLKLKEVDTYEEQVESLKSKSADIAAGYFIIKDYNINEINYSDYIYESKVYIIVRYSNLPESIEFKNPHESIEQFNGELLGVTIGSSYVPLTAEHFPKSKALGYVTFSELYYHLLMKNIEGFIIDEVIADYYQIVFNNKVTYYRLDIEEDNNAFGFQKNANGEALLNEFNEFISTLNLKEKYNKWYVLDTSKLFIDKNLDKNDKLINVAFNLQSKPLSFMEGNEAKGYEIEILYKFAKAKRYNLNVLRATMEERVTFLVDEKVEISGGLFTITDERKTKINFSNPLYSTGMALTVRIDSRKDMMQIKVLDNNYKEKTNNSAELKVKFSNSIKTSLCTFPNKYNDTILINCTISDLNNINSSKGFEYISTSDKINILSNNLELNNFFQANTKIIGHNNIIIEGNKENIICLLPFSWTNGSFIASIVIIILLLVILFLSRYL